MHITPVLATQALDTVLSPRRCRVAPRLFAWTKFGQAAASQTCTPGRDGAQYSGPGSMSNADNTDNADVESAPAPDTLLPFADPAPAPTGTP